MVGRSSLILPAIAVLPGNVFLASSATCSAVANASPGSHEHYGAGADGLQ